MNSLILFVIFTLTSAQSHIVPLIYAAPSAVSHQSRIDIKTKPAFVSSPLIYSPSTSILLHKPPETLFVKHELLSPISEANVLTHVAYGFYNNLPLARALQHPVYIKENLDNLQKITKDQSLVDDEDEKKIMQENQTKKR